MKTVTKPIDNAEKILLQVRELLQEELAIFDDLVAQELTSSVPLTEEITQHIFKSGGKRLRPLLLLLCAKAANPSAKLTTRHYELAAVIEFVHTATLLHDDVVDNSSMRRGKETANKIWNNQASILVGDFLYSRAFQILARDNNSNTMKTLAATTNALAEGELRQLMNQFNPDLGEADYLKVITEKTAQLFSAAAEIGTITAQASLDIQKAAADYGLHIGIAFQVIDDLLDYTSASEQLGKNSGDDLADSKTTLPIIYAITASSSAQANYLKETIKTGNTTELENILKILNETKALEKTRQKAEHHADKAAKALAQFPESPYRQAMQDLITFGLARTF